MIARVLRGGECTEPGAVSVRSAGPWGLALSKGLDSPAVKVDPNEDACGVVSGGVGSIVVVADAHFGRSSAEIAVDHILSVGLQEPPPRAQQAEVVWQWLRERLETANARVRAQQSTSACAILAAVLQGETLWWASIGDCRLYHVRGRECAVCNPTAGVFLGDRDTLDPEVGELLLQSGDRVVLASDGLPECRYGKETLFPAEIAHIISDQPPEAAARALVDAALAGGGEDNIAVAVAQV